MKTIDAQGGLVAQLVGMRGAEFADEGDGTDDADDDERGRDEGEDKSGEAEDEGEGASEDDESRMRQVQGPADEDVRGETEEGGEEAGEGSAKEAVNAAEVFRGEVTHGEGRMRRVQGMHGVRTVYM